MGMNVFPPMTAARVATAPGNLLLPLWSAMKFSAPIKGLATFTRDCYVAAGAYSQWKRRLRNRVRHLVSDRVRFATTIAGGITLAYGIALWMDWQRPYWAGLAVAMIGLSTIGESIFKGLQRLAGTAVAILVALALVSLFAQERWTFAFATSIWVGLCVWRMQNEPEIYYFWYCCGFIVPLLSIMSGFDSARSFYVVQLRAKETVLGIMCFTALALVLSHRSTYGELVGAVRAQIALLRKRLEDVGRRAHQRAQRKTQSGPSPRETELHEKIAHNFLSIPTLLTSAQMESFELRERDAAWHEITSGLQTISADINRLDLSFELGEAGDEDDQGLDLRRLDHTLDEFSSRLENASGLLSRSAAAARDSQSVDLGQASTAITGKSPFLKGERQLRRQIFADMDRDTRRLAAAAADTADKGPVVSPQRVPRPWIFVPDPEHMAIVLFQFLAFWFAFLVYIYLPAIPDGPVILVISVILAVNLSRMPWVSATKLVVPAIVASIYGLTAHAFIMPHLVGFSQLGTMIFIAIFTIAWLFHTEQLQVGRFLGIALFMLIIQVANQHQTYSAVYAMNVLTAILMMLLLLTLLQRAPISFRPEDVVRRLIRRFGRSLVAVLDGMKWDEPSANTWLARQLRLYHMNQLRTLPRRIDIWINKLPPAAARESDIEALKHLADNLHALAYRTGELVELRAKDAEEIWVERLREEVGGWRHGIENVVNELLDQRNVSDLAEVEARLDRKLKTIEKIVADAAVQDAAKSELRIEGTAHMQRVLSAYRGISKAVLGVARRSTEVGWQRLFEPRF